MFARKTDRGQAELTQRSLKFDSYTRRLLIFIDGQRNRQQLQALMGERDITPLLVTLLEHGCIEGDVSRANATPAAPEAGLEDSQDLPARSARELEMGRNFIINTLSTFTGPYAHADLMAEALKAQDQLSLRALLPQWRAALEVETPAKRLAELQGQLLKVI